MSPSIKREYKKIEVLLFAPEILLQECMRTLLRDNEQVNIVALADTEEKLFENYIRYQPEVVLYYLSERNHHILDTISHLQKKFPQAKVVVLIDSEKTEILIRALENGARGVVQKEKGVQTLINTIGQISSGKAVFDSRFLQELLKKEADKTAGNKNKNLTEMDALTKRELEVVKMIALGLKNKEIAERLSISEATVRHHLGSIFSKLMIEDRLNLVIYAYQHKLAEQ